MNRIDTETGYIYLGDVIITPDKKIDDYKEYEKAGLIKIIKDDKNYQIELNNLISVNEFDSSVIINFNKNKKITNVVFTPSVNFVYREIACIRILSGMINRQLPEDNKYYSFYEEYSWGNIILESYSCFDPHWGIDEGGDIIIDYIKEYEVIYGKAKKLKRKK